MMANKPVKHSQLVTSTKVFFIIKTTFIDALSEKEYFEFINYFFVSINSIQKHKTIKKHKNHST